MSRLIISMLAVTLFLGFSLQSGHYVESQTVGKAATNLDGVYEFVSESIVLTKPKKSVQNRTSSEWKGVWQLQSGYFTKVLMKKRRDSFFNQKKLDDVGFESDAGSYEVEEKGIRFTRDITFHPFYVGSSILTDYKIVEDELILTQTLEPYIEDTRKGTIITVLKKVK